MGGGGGGAYLQTGWLTHTHTHTHTHTVPPTSTQGGEPPWSTPDVYHLPGRLHTFTSLVTQVVHASKQFWRKKTKWMCILTSPLPQTERSRWTLSACIFENKADNAMEIWRFLLSFCSSKTASSQASNIWCRVPSLCWSNVPSKNKDVSISRILLFPLQKIHVFDKKE